MDDHFSKLLKGGNYFLEKSDIAFVRRTFPYATEVKVGSGWVIAKSMYSWLHDGKDGEISDVHPTKTEAWEEAAQRLVDEPRFPEL